MIFPAIRVNGLRPKVYEHTVLPPTGMDWERVLEEYGRMVEERVEKYS